MKRLAVAVAGLPATALVLLGALLLVGGVTSPGPFSSGFVPIGFVLIVAGAALLGLARAVSTDRVAPPVALGIVTGSVAIAFIGFRLLVPAEPDHCRGGEPGTGTDGWSTTGSMSTGRVPAVALLPDGQVLAAGGFGGAACGDPHSAELYDPETGAWTLTGSSTTAHSGLDAVVAMADGRVLVVGTIETTGAMTLEVYDPASGTWTEAARMGATRVGGVAVGLPDGRLLVAGGTGTDNPPLALASSELYDPTTGQWTPAGPMGEARAYASAAMRLLDGRVLVAGGLSAGEGPLTSAELYDPDSGTWSQTGAMIAAMEQGNGILLQDGRVLVLAGPQAQLYDPDTGTWRAVSGRTASSGQAAVVLDDGRVLVAGGSPGDGMTAEIYDPESEAWTPAGRMGTARQQSVAVLLADGRVLVVGGLGAVNDVAVTLSSAELYDPDGG